MHVEIPKAGNTHGRDELRYGLPAVRHVNDSLELALVVERQHLDLDEAGVEQGTGGEQQDHNALAIHAGGLESSPEVTKGRARYNQTRCKV